MAQVEDHRRLYYSGEHADPSFSILTQFPAKGPERAALNVARHSNGPATFEQEH